MERNRSPVGFVGVRVERSRSQRPTRTQPRRSRRVICTTYVRIEDVLIGLLAKVDVSDPIETLRYPFSPSVPQLAPPHGEPGSDPTPDRLSCNG